MRAQYFHTVLHRIVCGAHTAADCWSELNVHINEFMGCDY